jgi:hypothetical protein
MRAGLIILLRCSFLPSAAAQTGTNSLPDKYFGHAVLLWSLAQLFPWTYEQYVVKAVWAQITLKTLK